MTPLSQLGTAFGRLTFLRGAAALISPPLAATLAEHYGVRLFPLYLSAGFFAILRLIELEKAVVEGAGATGLAAVMAGLLPELRGKK